MHSSVTGKVETSARAQDKPALTKMEDAITPESKANNTARAVSGAELRRLKGLAQRISNVTRLGHAGLTPAFITAVNQELANHELVKIKFTDHKEEKHEISEQLAKATNSHLIWVIGHVAVLYRKSAKPEETGD